MVGSDDLRIAKLQLKLGSATFVVAKYGRILYAGYSPGVLGLLRAVEVLGDVAAGASLADSVVGKAAAMLCRQSRISAVHAVTLSKTALQQFETSKLPISYENLVPRILNRDKTGPCPFEQSVEDIEDPVLAAERLKQVRVEKSAASTPS